MKRDTFKESIAEEIRSIHGEDSFEIYNSIGSLLIINQTKNKKTELIESEIREDALHFLIF